jgi:hypothetical protein
MTVTDHLRPRTVSRPAGRVAALAITTGLGMLLTGPVGVSPAAAATTTTALSPVTFTSVGEHAFRVPAGVFSIHVVAIGGKGGGLPDTAPGGAGARVEGDLAVRPGQILYAEVGGAGATATEQSWSLAAGGDNGGGAGGVYNLQDPPSAKLGLTDMSGGGGGGASDVRTFSKRDWPSSWALSSRLLVAGGGGGASSAGPGGDGGNPNGQTPTASGSLAGRGATTSAGGTGGGVYTARPGGHGGLGAGGNGGPGTYHGGGGGGGGYYGGGGGGGSRISSGAGGGGSSYGPAGTSYTSSSAPGSVTISYQPTAFAARLAPASNTAVTLNVSSFSTSPGAAIIQWHIVITASEVWNFIPKGDDYWIINRNSGLCLTTPGVAGKALYQYPCAGWASQLWNTSLTPGSSTPAQIKNPSSGLYLQAHGGSTAPGVAIVTEPSNAGSNNQFFYATPA